VLESEEMGGLVEAQLGVAVLRVEPIAAGLGLRRFLRVYTAGEPPTVVVRIEAPDDPRGRPAGVAPEPPLEPLRGYLEAHGLPVPARFGGDPARGIDILEDVGARSLADVAPSLPVAERTRLYRTALGWLPVLQGLADPGGLPAFARRLDRSLIRYKGELFASWSLPAALGRPASPAEVAVVTSTFERIADALEDAPLRLAHRDFQSQNLQLRAARGGGGPQLALLDVQGAFLAPPEYDAVCLLRDSYVELTESELREHLAWLRPQLPDAPDPDTFQRRFDLITVTRKGKDHARFLYAAQERGDRRWLRHVPATARALRAAAPRLAAQGPAFADLAGWLARLPDTPCAR
jgi:aminoglycoside/choline kinase family phosphotransferase